MPEDHPAARTGAQMITKTVGRSYVIVTFVRVCSQQKTIHEQRDTGTGTVLMNNTNRDFNPLLSSLCFTISSI
jgi:hypothetical protein